MFRHLLAAFAIALGAASATAQEARFDVMLGGRVLGQVAIEETGRDARLTSVLDNTPLGVGDGRFDATSVAGRDYRSLGASPGETRRIDVDYDGARVARVEIDPPSEATELSDPSAVPAGTLDPVRGVARIALARDCVAPFRVYDGRRLVDIGLSGRTLDAGTLTCDYAYRVTGGPGHLSPFRFSEISMRARYDVPNGAVSGIRDITLGAGPFTLRLAAR